MTVSVQTSTSEQARLEAGQRQFWSDHEIAVLRANYASLGAVKMAAKLPGRSVSSIYQRAAKLGLKAPAMPPGPRQRWRTTPQIDLAIRTALARPPRKNMMADLAKAVWRPRWWVSKRAIALGLVSPRAKEKPWSDAEIELAVTHAHKNPDTIRRIMAAQGYRRTATAILVKLKRQGCGTGKNADLDHYSGTALATLFGVNPTTVTHWINKGWLRAAKRGTARTAAQGGDEWAIHRRDVRAFVIDNVALVDFRKADKFWMVELLANNPAPQTRERDRRKSVDAADERAAA